MRTEGERTCCALLSCSPQIPSHWRKSFHKYPLVPCTALREVAYEARHLPQHPLSRQLSAHGHRGETGPGILVCRPPISRNSSRMNCDIQQPKRIIVVYYTSIAFPYSRVTRRPSLISAASYSRLLVIRHYQPSCCLAVLQDETGKGCHSNK